MTYLDRTVEFNNATESIRIKQNVTKPVKRTPIQQKSQFTMAASKIGKELYDTSDKLAKLTKLAKKTSFIFDDSPAEIEELTFIIKQNIHTMNKEISLLKELAKSSSSTQNQSHSDTVITLLNTKLATTTKDFKEILQHRTETIKTQQDKKVLFTGTSTSLSTPNRVATGSVLYKSNLDSLPDSPSRSGGEVAIVIPQSMMLMHQDDYTSQRAVAVENIERTIVELGGIFQQLASLVAEQGDTLQRIDQNISDSEIHVEKGRDALIKVLYNVSSSRMLIVKLFLVLIVFAVIFIVFFV